MCKHVLNAQVSIRAPCCKRWFDCPQCHAEQSDHRLKKTTEMVFGCKKCKKVFRKDMTTFDETDEYCPGCDNHFVIDAVTPESKATVVVGFEGDTNMIRDEREKPKAPRDSENPVPLYVGSQPPM